MNDPSYSWTPDRPEKIFNRYNVNKKIEQIRNIGLHVLRLIEDLTAFQLNKIPEGYNNNVIWNISHLISAQQSVCYVRSNQPYTVTDAFYRAYQPSTKPADHVDEADILLIKETFITSIDDLENDITRRLFDQYKPWFARPYGIRVNNIEDAMDFLIYHEGLHTGYIMALKHLL